MTDRIIIVPVARYSCIRKVCTDFQTTDKSYMKKMIRWASRCAVRGLITFCITLEKDLGIADEQDEKDCRTGHISKILKKNPNMEIEEINDEYISIRFEVTNGKP